MIALNTTIPNMIIDPDKLKICKYYKLYYCRGLWKVCRTDLKSVTIIQVDLRDREDAEKVDSYDIVPNIKDGIVFDLDAMDNITPYMGSNKTGRWKIVRVDAVTAQMLKFNAGDVSYFGTREAPKSK